MSSTASPVRARVWRALAAPLAASAYLVMPAAGWGWLDGAPLGWLEAAALALVWWAWTIARTLPGARLIAMLAVAKLALAGAFLDRGLTAHYYANDAWTPPAERSIEFARAPFTRRDQRLMFGSGGAPDLPLYFFNNVRWNYYRPDEPQRDRLGYSAEWSGFLHVNEVSADATFYVDAGPGIAHELSIDGRPVIPLDGAAPRLRSIELAPGWHALTIRMKAPYGASRRIEAGEVVAGARQPFDAGRVVQERPGAVRLVIDTALRWTTRAIDVVLLSGLGVLVLVCGRRVFHERRIVPLLWLGAIAEAVWHASPYLNRMIVLGGGDDMLMYEHFARVIALGDPLMQAPGPGGGQGAPYYFQPLYPYFLALTHFGFGDGLFGAVLIQRLLLAATVSWVAAMTTRLCGTRAGWIALIGGGVFLYSKGARWTDVLLSEPLFMPLLVGWIALLVRTAVEHASRTRVAAAGVVGGIATLTRPTLLAGWPPILLVWWASVRCVRGGHLATLLVCLIAVANLTTVRNWIVAGRLVFAPTSFGASLQLGNSPARPLVPMPPERARLYDRFGIDPNVRAVSEFAVQASGDFVRGLRNKALYTVGLFGLSGLPGGIGTSWTYVGMWALAIVGAIRIARSRTMPSGAAAWLPAAGALSHVAPLVLVFPHGYTDRLILPLYPLLIPYAAFALEPLPPLLVPMIRRLPLTFGNATRVAGRRIVAVAVSVLRQPRNWAYLVYTAAVLPISQAGAALLLPAAALAVAALGRRGAMQRPLAGGLWAMALLRVAAVGSQSPQALHDPLFWGLASALALGASLVTGRWKPVSIATAAIAGGCATVATLLLGVGGSDSSFPSVDVDTLTRSVTEFVQQFGLPACLSLIALLAQAQLPTRGREGRIAAAARGALLAGMALSIAGVPPGQGLDTHVWLVGLGAVLGLVEADARRPASTPDSTDARKRRA